MFVGMDWPRAGRILLILRLSVLRAEYEWTNDRKSARHAEAAFYHPPPFAPEKGNLFCKVLELSQANRRSIRPVSQININEARIDHR